ncbi:hypothetical protein OHA40_32245 [Nocardia sp. NBC_00508]|uniref:hypothetical protein n=1 Tax=Nocardia sp. NBC_00508 TaxID=2975992 RepID=UPI002E8164FD|nr:hypothetical protein [Nocardia sp. NBC_00508]WUD66177.1 hypothetical protein OHA40_32245 [Nocardia sp. NBC_00508]
MSECHIRVQLEGFPPLDFRAERDAALNFAHAASSVGVIASTDDDIRDDLPLLPCARLWRWP